MFCGFRPLWTAREWPAMTTPQRPSRRACRGTVLAGGVFLFAVALGSVAHATQYLQPVDPAAQAESMEKKRQMPAELWYLVLNRNLPQGALSVSVAPFDKSTVRLTCNLGDRQEIGVWRAPVAAADFARIKSLARESGYARLVDDEPLAPTMPTISLGEGTLGEAPRLVAWPVNGVPLPVQPLLDAVGDVVDQILEHPDQVLAGAAEPEKGQLAAGDPVAFIVTLRNPGTSALQLRNPALAAAARDTGLILTLRQLGKLAPSGGPEGEDREIEDTASVEIGPAEVQFLRDAEQPEDEDDPFAGAWLELLPDDVIRFRILRAAFLQPATYEAALVLSCRGSDQPEDRAVEGNLLMVAGRFEVVPAGRR